VAKEDSHGIQVIAKSAAVMRALEQHPQGLTLNELITHTGIPKSTLHRLCSALQEEDLTLYQDGVWRLGTGIVRLAASSHERVISRLRPLLERLAWRTRETVDLCVFRGQHTLLVDQVMSDQELRVVSPLGTAFPVHMTAHGKAMLATLDDNAVKELFPEEALIRRTDASHESRTSLLQELEVIRSHGLGVDLQEHAAGVCALGVALNTGGRELYGLALAVPDLRFERDLESLRSSLLQTRAEIDALFGEARD
tara:strand:- start:262 stop:1020 length:759 start_codon:yes stop_codon:yes gene_type:complete